MFSMVEAVKFKPINNFPLNDAVKCFDVSVFLRCGNMSELLVSFCGAQVLLDIMSGKSGAVIIPDGHSFNFIRLIDSSESVNDINLPDALLKDLVNGSTGEYIQNG